MKQLGFQPELEVWTSSSREVLDLGKISPFIVEHFIQFEGSSRLGEDFIQFEGNFDFLLGKLYLPHLGNDPTTQVCNRNTLCGTHTPSAALTDSDGAGMHYNTFNS